MRAFLVLVSVLAISDDTLSKTMVGNWYGDNYQPAFHNYFQELDRVMADGTFEVEFRRYVNCKLVFHQDESGTWGISSGVVHRETTAINGANVDRNNPYFHDDYEILDLDEHDYRDRRLSDGTIYNLWRVGKKFEFSDCDFTS
jgi:hypothetical protein